MTSDPYDLGIDPEYVYETETWMPSADYPDITRHRLTRVGDALTITITPPYGRGAEFAQVKSIGRVHRKLGRAELTGGGATVPEHFDLQSRRIVDAQAMFRVTLVLERELDDVLLDALTTLGELAPTLYPTIAARRFERADLERLAWSDHAESRSIRTRWASPSPNATPEDLSFIPKLFGFEAPKAEPGFGFTREVLGSRDLVELSLAESLSPLFQLYLGRNAESSPRLSATITGYMKPGPAALDAAIGRLRAVLRRGDRAD